MKLHLYQMQLLPHLKTTNFKIKMRILFVVCSLLFATTVYCSEIKKPEFLSCDINGDGIKDVLVMETVFDVVTNKYNSNEATFKRSVTSAFYGTPQGISTKAAWSFTSDSIENFSSANFDFDVNNDGIKDLLAISNILSPTNKKTHPAIIVIYNSKGGFTNQLPVVLKDIDMPEIRSRLIYFGDYNKDGFADVVVKSWLDISKQTSISHKQKIFYGIANGFMDEQNFNTDDKYRYLTGFDYDGDHQPDSVKINYTNNYQEYSIMLSGKKQEEEWQTFHSSMFSSGGYNFYQVGDINGDGYCDACIAKISSNHDVKKNNAVPYTITVFPGSANGLSKDSLAAFTFNIIAPIFILDDFDGDGFADIMLKAQDDFSLDYTEYTNFKKGQSTDVYAPIHFIWGGNIPQADTAGYAAFSKFINENRLTIKNIGDINDDKRNDLVLFNQDKQYIIYGNKERQFNPVEWIHN